MPLFGYSLLLLDVTAVSYTHLDVYKRQGAVSDIVWFVRLPRLVLAVGVGMCLSLAGVVMQAIVRNPLADPYVLGVSSGASLGASLAILTGVGTGLLGANAPGVLAFICLLYTSRCV